MANRWGNSEILYYLGAPKSLQMVTAAMKLKDACSLEEKLWPTWTSKSRDITLSTKVHLVKAMAFPVIMYGCESWTIKTAEHWRIDAFELRCWRRLLRVPWTARRSNQSILKDISPEYSFEGLMLKLKLQYFGHLMQRTDSLEKTLMLGKTDGRRRSRQQRMRWLNGITISMDMKLSMVPGVGDGQGNLAHCSPWTVGHDWVTELSWNVFSNTIKSQHNFTCLFSIFFLGTCDGSFSTFFIWSAFLFIVCVYSTQKILAVKFIAHIFL